METIKSHERVVIDAFLAHANEILARKGETFNINPENRAVYNTLVNAILLNWYDDIGKDLLSRNIDRKRGFLIIGDIGLGKSTLFRLFKSFCTKYNGPSFGMYTAKQVSDHYKLEGNIDRFLNKTSTFKRYPTICIDELGREDKTVNNFGTATNVISNLLQERYSLWQNHGVITHYITNLNLDEIKDRYGEFLRSRIVEQCNILVFNGKNRRK